MQSTLATVVLATVLIPAWSQLTQPMEPAHIMSSFYAYDGCMAVDNPPDPSDSRATEAYFQDLIRRSCVVKQDPATGQYKTNAKPKKVIQTVCKDTSDRISYLDANPIVFNYPLDPPSVQKEDVQVLLSDGTAVTPDCVLLGPANEADELNTLLMLGQFGDGMAGRVHPIQVNIVGDVNINLPTGQQVNAKGLTYSRPWEMMYGAPLRLNKAYIYPSGAVEPENFPPKPPGVYPNRCQDLFPETAYVIKTVFTAGVSLDGLNSLTPDMKKTFGVYLNDGTCLENQILGLADLGQPRAPGTTGPYMQDGDNIVDICLSVDQATADRIALVMATCNPFLRTQLVAPKGNFPCLPTSARVQPLEEFRKV